MILWTLITLLGFASFIFHFEKAVHLLAASSHKWPLFALQAFLTALTIPFHEFAHAFTTKYFGRKVHCFGLGWLWLGPFAFCDTSDMWISPKKEQVMVDMAGIFLNVTLAGLAGLCVLFINPANQDVTIVLELFALSSYLIVIANLNTSFEFDGYYALMDIMGKPNLRLSAIKWLRELFSSQAGVDGKGTSIIYKWESTKAHHKEAIYVLTTLISIFILGSIVPYIVFNYLLQGLLGVTNPLINIIITLVTVSLSTVGIYKDVRRHSSLASR